MAADHNKFYQHFFLGNSLVFIFLIISVITYSWELLSFWDCKLFLSHKI